MAEVKLETTAFVVLVVTSVAGAIALGYLVGLVLR